MSDTYRKLIDEIAVAVTPRVPSANPEPIGPSRSEYAMLSDALSALRVLSAPGLRDFPEYLHAQTRTKLARANREAASLALELELMRERCAELLSQAEPVASLNADRELVRQMLNYVQCGRLK